MNITLIATMLLAAFALLGLALLIFSEIRRGREADRRAARCNAALTTLNSYR